MERDKWGSDTPISAPLADDALTGSPVANLGGFVFGNSALRLPVNSATHEERYSPVWAPQVNPYRDFRRGSTH